MKADWREVGVAILCVFGFMLFVWLVHSCLYVSPPDPSSDRGKEISRQYQCYFQRESCDE